MSIISDATSKLSGIGVSLPKTSTITSGITIFALFVLISVMLGVIAYLFIQWKQYNRKVEFYENVSGLGYLLTKKDTAKLIKLGDGGEELLITRKGKQYLTAYGTKSGKNKYLFAKGGDGYWYNFKLGNLDKTLREMNIDPIDRDMRYMNVAIRKNTKDRFVKSNWLKDNIGMIVGFSVIIIVLLFIWLIFDKWMTISNSLTATIEAANKVLDSTQKILAANDNILHGGSGLAQA